MRALLLALLLTSPVLAQEEPTPFWMAPPPPSAKKKPPAKAEKKKKAEKKQKAPPPARVEKKPRPSRKAAPEPTWIEPTPSRAAEKRAPPPAPVERPKHEAIDVEPSAPAASTRRPVAPLAPAPEPSSRGPAAPLAPAPEPSARRPVAPIEPAPAQRLHEPSAPSVPAAHEPSAPSAHEPSAPQAERVQPAVLAPERLAPEPPRAPGQFPTLTAGAVAGLWGKTRSDGTGRDYQFAWGVRFGLAAWFMEERRLVAEIFLARAGTTDGSPFVNASATHNLALLRAFWTLGPPDYSLLLGGGAGLVLAQTHYTLLDVGGSPVGLDATSGKTVMEITAVGRARIFRGLEVRAEVSAVLRDGQVEYLPLLGLGVAY